MCRIAGIINPSKTIPELEKQVKAMCESMKHGGPDDKGIYTDDKAHVCIGNRRLSLLDLSKAGHQPMQDSSGRCFISFNGEIYNYLELRQELLLKGHLFRSQTDTEVILAAYLEWGTSAFARLDGMFAFSLYDTAEQHLFLVRDGAGIKPLYYALDKNSLVFSSEIKAFKETDKEFAANADWRLMLLCFGHIPEPYTSFRDVRSLPKGHYLHYPVIAGSETKVIPFRKGDEPVSISDKGTAIRTIRTELKASVIREMKCDAPLGILLSGGIDSGIIAFLASQSQERPISTLSLDFDEAGFSERPYQEDIVACMNPSHASQKIGLADLQNNLNAIKAAFDQPSCDGINTWFVAKFAHEQGLKAIISGIGSDELFGGYPSFKRLSMIAAIQKLPNSILATAALLPYPTFNRLQWLQLRDRSTGMFLALRGLFSPSEAGKMLGISSSEVICRIDNLQLQPLMPVEFPENEAAGWLEFNLYMQNQLLKDSDYMSMQHAVELRVPFLSTKFVAAVDAIRPELLFGHGGLPKQLLIDAFKDILPTAVWDRPKMGFSFPLQNWLGRIRQLRETVEKENAGMALMKDFDKGNAHWSKVWAYYMSLDFAA